MRTIDIHSLLAWVVGIVEHVGLSVGDMLPEGQVGVADSQLLNVDVLHLLAAGDHHGATGCPHDHAQALCFHLSSYCLVYNWLQNYTNISE